jgi:hypothetical protein
VDQLLKLRAQRLKEVIGFERHEERAAVEERKQASETRKQERHKLVVSLAEAKLDRQALLNATPDPVDSFYTGEQNRERERADSRQAA